MLDSKGIRQLAYMVKIDDIKPIIGSDNCECAVVGGWNVMVRKSTFVPGDFAIYFEIDSKVDTARPEFAFLNKCHGKIKTQRYTFGGKGLMISQGLLMHPSEFNWEINKGYIVINGVNHCLEDDSRFLTKELGVVYSVAEDNTRKSNSVDKYKAMAQRNPHIFSKPFVKKIMRYKLGRSIMFLLFGKKRDKSNDWPAWVVKTDEERIQNMPWILENKEPWIVTEKVDGTSTTFTIRRHKIRKNKFDFYICSRNVVFNSPNQNCYYDTNYYIEMAKKYDIEMKLSDIMLTHPEYKWVTLQGETYGPGVQRRDYSLAANDHCFRGFNYITSAEGRWNSERAADFMSYYSIPWVPIVNDNYILPDTVDELLNYADGNSIIDGKEREGFVFRSLDGTKSFKAVSNNYLIKYHG